MFNAGGSAEEVFESLLGEWVFVWNDGAKQVCDFACPPAECVVSGVVEKASGFVAGAFFSLEHPTCGHTQLCGQGGDLVWLGVDDALRKNQVIWVVAETTGQRAKESVTRGNEVCRGLVLLEGADALLKVGGRVHVFPVQTGSGLGEMLEGIGEAIEWGALPAGRVRWGWGEFKPKGNEGAQDVVQASFTKTWNVAEFVWGAVGNISPILVFVVAVEVVEILEERVAAEGG